MFRRLLDARHEVEEIIGMAPVHVTRSRCIWSSAIRMRQHRLSARTRQGGKAFNVFRNNKLVAVVERESWVHSPEERFVWRISPRPKTYGTCVDDILCIVSRMPLHMELVINGDMYESKSPMMLFDDSLGLRLIQHKLAVRGTKNVVVKDYNNSIIIEIAKRGRGALSMVWDRDMLDSVAAFSIACVLWSLPRV